MNLEEIDVLAPKYVNIVQTTTSHINNIQQADNELAEKKLES